MSGRWRGRGCRLNILKPRSDDDSPTARLSCPQSLCTSTSRTPPWVVVFLSHPHTSHVSRRGGSTSRLAGPRGATPPLASQGCSMCSILEGTLLVLCCAVLRSAVRTLQVHVAAAVGIRPLRYSLNGEAPCTLEHSQAFPIPSIHLLLDTGNWRPIHEPLGLTLALWAAAGLQGTR